MLLVHSGVHSKDSETNYFTVFAARKSNFNSSEGRKKSAWGRVAVSRPRQLILARVTIQPCMNEKLQQCGVQLPPSNQYVSGDIIWQAEGAVPGLFAAPEEEVSFCLWPEEVKVLQMFYIRYKKGQLWFMAFFSCGGCQTWKLRTESSWCWNGTRDNLHLTCTERRWSGVMHIV